MSNEIAPRQQLPPARQYRATVEGVARQFLAEKAATPEGKALATRFAMGFAAAATAAKRPSDFYSANPASIAAAAAKSLDTGLVPGGVMPDVWLIPRSGEIQWMPSHRGLIRLARKAGYIVRAVVVHTQDLDSVELVDGEVSIKAQNPSLYVSNIGDIGGVAVFARDRATGERICAHWVPGAKIAASRNAGQGGSVWGKWPAEMAAKAAIKDAFARGYIPLESDALQVAISSEPEYAPRPALADVESVPGLSEPASSSPPEPPEPTDGEWEDVEAPASR